MRSRDQGRGACRSNMIIIAVFIAIVSVSNIVLFHFMHEDTMYIPGSMHRTPSVHHDSTPELTPESVKETKTVNDVAEKEKPILSEGHHPVAGLNCADHGGPSNEVAEEMIFWSDIKADSDYRSPFYDEEKYITFEPDHGGWNNIRMAMETILVLAHAMGRTLVLPPEKGMYLLGKGKKDHKKSFSFNDFFHLDAVAMEHEGLNIITMEEFLLRKGVTGQLKSLQSGKVMKPPDGTTNWNGQQTSSLYNYLETVGRFPEGWEPTTCIAAIPSSPGQENVDKLQGMMDDIMKLDKLPNPDKGDYNGAPVDVDAPAEERFKEMMATRTNICIYDTELQNEQLLHFKIDHKEKARMLTHFYAFVFFQDWKQDLWSKRFIRDHVRYIDEIICAAARIVDAVREKAKSLNPGNTDGKYNSFHVRRGDFQYKKVKAEASVLLQQSKDELEKGSYLYIATDERNKSFFDPFNQDYNVGFLDDYMHLIKDINPNYYGMLDQLVAYKGEVFFGTWFSTLSGYVNRMRGYYSAKHKQEGYKEGILNSYYFVPKEKKEQMRKYRAVKLPIYMREFPTSWRDIDKGIDEL